MKKKLVALVLGLMVSTVPVQLIAKGQISVTIDNQFVNFPDAKPFVDKNARTLVPIRFISEELGANVDWDGSTKTVDIEQGEKDIQLKIGSNTVVVDGEPKKMDTEPIMKDSRTFVPLRFVSEELGVDVEYLSEVNTVKITTGKEVEVTHIDEYKAYPVETYGEVFKGLDSKEVVVVGEQNLPINNGRYTIFSIAISENAEQILVTQKANSTNGKGSMLWFADDNGTRRGRRVEEVTKNSDGTITSKYNVVSLSDYGVAGEDFDKYKVSAIEYFVFEGNGKMLAIENILGGNK